MKNRKYLIIGVIILLLVIGASLGIYFYNNSKHLTVNEKNWLDKSQSANQVLNINIINNANVFGKNGTGIFYNFIDDFANEYGLNINKITYNYGGIPGGISLGAKTFIDDKDTVFYIDHYVLISKKYSIINDISNLAGSSIGILSSDLSYVTNYITNLNINYKAYENSEELFKGLEESDYIIVPLYLYLEDILNNNYKVVYHFSDINMYYVLSINDDVFSSILVKYYQTWQDNFNDYFNENLFNIMVQKLQMSSTEIDAMRSITYEYGYISNSPYEVISGGNYGGIAAVYLKKFMDFADVDFNFTKYGNFNKFNRALGKDKIDIYFGYYNLVNNFIKTESGINVSYAIVANSKNDLVINSVSSLIGKTVYVDKKSILYSYLSNINGVKIKTYSNTKELLKLNRKDVIIFIDYNIFEYYKSHGLSKYTVRYVDNINSIYGFNVKKDNAMYKLLNEYMNITDSHQILNQGIYNHEKTVKSGLLLSLIAKYFIYFVLAFGLIGFIIIRKTRKVTIAKKIKKDDKLRFIDQLTLLKNRNYLAENISKWNNNTIYPQAIVIVDLKHLQQINDVEGYDEGDKQIRAAANALIKTQLDNSDIIRTDGNEFVIYMVGYSQKQLTNYIHKLNKEFKKLPYKYGAEFGYSMIIDDIKTIEDALNEATKALKEQKELNEDKN